MDPRKCDLKIMTIQKSNEKNGFWFMFWWFLIHVHMDFDVLRCVKMCEGSIASCFFQNPRSPSLVMPIVTMLSDLIPTMSHLWVKWFLGPRIAYLYI